MWIPPKTNWKITDSFDLYTDYFRIKNNILELGDLVERMYKTPGLISMGDYEVNGVGFAAFYNNVEQNIDILADAGFRNPDMLPTKKWTDNKAAWTYKDLNRIESSLEMMYKNLSSALAARPVLSLTLGINQYVEPKIST